MKHLTFLFLAFFFLVSCNQTPSSNSTETLTKTVADMSDEELRTYADELAQKYIIADGHVDLPYRLGTRFFRMYKDCLLYTSPSPRDATLSRMPSSA